MQDKYYSKASFYISVLYLLYNFSTCNNRFTRHFNCCLNILVFFLLILF